MKRIAGGLALAASLVLSAPAAFANDANETERRLEEVLAELEAQRQEIDALKGQLAAQTSGIDTAVKSYLASAALEEEDPNEFKVFWKEGLNFKSNNGDHALKINGRIMNDWTWASADSDVETAVGKFRNMTEFRRLRIEMTGTIYKNIYYKNVLDFAGAAHAYKDQLIGIKGLPYVGNFQVGYFKEPVGLEELTSSKYITFMERSLTSAFVPAHNSGFMAHNTAVFGNLTWALGWFSDTNGMGMGEIAQNLAGRVTYTPLVDKENQQLLHVGLSAQKRHPQSESNRLRARPETHINARVVDTGTYSVEDETIFGLEAAFVSGPMSVQAEYYKYDGDHHSAAGPGEDPKFDGFYAMVSWFLTGESRPYKKGSFGRVKPKNNYDGEGGSGAWEVALRYSQLDLDSGAIRGGDVQDWTLGVNWYLNPNTRVMFNYVMSDINGATFDGDAKAFMIRFQVDF